MKLEIVVTLKRRLWSSADYCNFVTFYLIATAQALMHIICNTSSDIDGNFPKREGK